MILMKARIKFCGQLVTKNFAEFFKNFNPV